MKYSFHVCHSELNSGLVNDGIEFGRFGLWGLFVSLTIPFKIWVFQFPSRLVWNQHQKCLGFLSLREIVASNVWDILNCIRSWRTSSRKKRDKLTIRPLSSPSARGFQHHPKHHHFSRGGWVMFWCHFWVVPVMGVQMVVKNSKNEWFILRGFHPFAGSFKWVVNVETFQQKPRGFLSDGAGWIRRISLHTKKSLWGGSV